ncbi:MAG: hypothetical protein K8S15_13115 [Candidatus Aegiribacteria sp.]|nr:hypothetical protein [Candidatus Aegiribacteria sp.]
MRLIAFLAIVLIIFSANLCAQPAEDEPSSQDSLQITEEVYVPIDDEPSSQDSLQITEVVDILDEDVPVDLVPNDPSFVLQEFFLALKEGNSFMLSQLISNDGLEEIDIMLDILNENIKDNEESTLSRLTAAGYTATADEIDDWSALDYLTTTMELPVMKARYSLYEMQIGEYSSNGDDLVIPLIFSTASGMELPYNAVLTEDNNQWKVTNFMGLNSFP